MYQSELNQYRRDSDKSFRSFVNRPYTRLWAKTKALTPRYVKAIASYLYLEWYLPTKQAIQVLSIGSGIVYILWAMATAHVSVWA